MASLLDKLTAKRDAAYAASSKASDSGAVVFAEHRGWAAALRDNKAAQRAWQYVQGMARGVDRLDPAKKAGAAEAQQFTAEWSQDAQDRIEELQVAFQAIQDDMRANLKLGLRERARIDLHLPYQPGGGASSYGASAPTGGSMSAGAKLGLLGLALAAGTKIAGLW